MEQVWEEKEEHAWKKKMGGEASITSTEAGLSPKCLFLSYRKYLEHVGLAELRLFPLSLDTEMRERRFL